MSSFESLDYSRESVPHKKGEPKPYFVSSDEDEFTRLTLLPLIWKLSPDQRTQFDEQLVSDFDPEAGHASPRVVQAILHRLSYGELIQVSSSIEYLNAPAVNNDLEADLLAGTLGNPSEIENSVPDVSIDKNAMIQYFYDIFGTEEKAKAAAGRLWNRLVHCNHINFILDGRATTVFTSPHDRVRCLHEGSVNLSELIRLVNYWEERKTEHPNYDERVILGRYWGPVTVSNLKRLITDLTTEGYDTKSHPASK